MIKRKKPIQEEEQQYYVYLKNPPEFRRQLLESAKRSVHSVKSYHRLVLLRQKKLEEAETLKKILTEIAYLNKKLNERLPEYDHAKSKHRAKEEVNHQVRHAEVSKPHKEKSEIDKLESSLAEIEKKLRNLK